MKQIDFNAIIDRRGTNSSKWDGYARRYPGLDSDGCLPMWVADMDFRCPDEVVDAVTAKAQFGIFGYECRKDDSFNDAVTGWLERRFGWSVAGDAVCYCPGVVPLMCLTVNAYSEPGDGVIVCTPVYYPFSDSIKNNGRRIVNSPLVDCDGSYSFDFENLEKIAADPSNKILMLCNPHNPVGRVWTRAELERLGDICIKHNLLIFSDEIHSDFVFEGHQHIPIASVNAALADITVTAYSASKTFNLAGLQCASVIIPNAARRAKYLKAQDAMSLGSLNSFGALAMKTAYNECAYYVDQLVPYIKANFDFADAFLKAHAPVIQLRKAQGTYLAWLDLSATGMDEDAMQHFMIEQAKVACDFGGWFGPGGEAFMRVNFACPRTMLEQALNQIATAWHACSNA